MRCAATTVLLLSAAAAVDASGSTLADVQVENRRATFNSSEGALCEFGRDLAAGVSSDAAHMDIQVVSLVERTADGDLAGANNADSHVITPDAGWTIKNMTFTATAAKTRYFQGLQTTNVNMTAPIWTGSDTKLQIRSYIFQEDGTIVVGDSDVGTETTVVTNGTMKLTFAVTDWPFCNSSASVSADEYCLDDSSVAQDGAYLDISFTVIGPSQRMSTPAACTDGGMTDKVEAKFKAETGLSATANVSRDDIQEWLGGEDGTGTGGGMDQSGSGSGTGSGTGGSTGGGDRMHRRRQLHTARVARSARTAANGGRKLSTTTTDSSPKGYDFSGDSSTGFKALLDVSRYFWGTDFGWAKLPQGAANYTDPTSHSEAIFTVRMNATAGTLLYDPTATITSTASLTADTGGDDDADDDTSAAFFAALPAVVVTLFSLLLTVAQVVA